MPESLSRQILNAATDAAWGGAGEMWIEVIHKMDAVYADLLRSQVEIEEKNMALEKAHQFISSVLEAMSDVLVVCDLQGRVQQVNQALTDLHGKDEASVLGHAIEQLFDPSSHAVLRECLERIRAGETCEHEVLLQDAEGKGSPLVIRCSPQFDHDGALLGMVLIGRPVGELRRAYNELNQAHRELQQAQQHLVQSEKMASLGRLVAGVAHELNNPISFVHSNMHIIRKYGYRLREYIAVLHERVQDPEIAELRRRLKIDRILEDIPSLVEGGLEGTERVSAIVQDLRRFSSAKRGKVCEFDLVALAEGAAKWVLQASRKRVRLHMRGASSLRIRNYEGFIHQVIVNLVQNSLDAMEHYADPQVEIHCARESADEVSIQVRDYGTGIPEEDLLRIFDPFFTTKDIGKGTGLGLYVSYGLIVEQCGGRMLASNHPDGGAVFTVQLPCDVERQA